MAIRTVIKPVGGDPTQKLARVFDRIRQNAVDARRWLGQIGLYIRREAQRHLRGRTKEWGPSSGRLSRSLAIALDAASVAVGSNLAYAAVQQLGHPGIEPKGHKYLAIPVPANLRRRGVWPRDLPTGSMRFKPNAEIKIGTKSWIGPALVRAEDQTHYVTNENGKRRAVGRRKPKDEVMFALVKRVRIKARPYLMFDSKAQAFAIDAAAKAFSRAIGRRGTTGR